MVKNPPSNAGDATNVSLIPGLGRSARGGNGTPLQFYCLGNSMDKRAWQATIQRVAEWDTTEAIEHDKLNKRVLYHVLLFGTECLAFVPTDPGNSKQKKRPLER